MVGINLKGVLFTIQSATPLLQSDFHSETMVQMFGICKRSSSGFDQSRPSCAKHPRAAVRQIDANGCGELRAAMRHGSAMASN
jgi:hypothetical protein